MILRELCRYHDRRAAMGGTDAPVPEGFIRKEIDFLIDLDAGRGGDELTDLREEMAEGRRIVLRGKPYIVPSLGGRSQKHDNSGKDANLLWDNAAFVLGIDRNGDGRKAAARLDAFRSVLRAHYPDPPGDVRAVLAFLEDDARLGRLRDRAMEDPAVAGGSARITFRVGGRLPIEEDHVREAVRRGLSAARDGARRGVCLVTGEADCAIARTHPVLRNVPGGQGAGCSVVAFNAPSFCSHGMRQGENAQIGMHAADKYVKALQMLIDSRTARTSVADAMVLAWTDGPPEDMGPLEDGWSAVFNDAPTDDPDRGAERIRALLESVRNGRLARADGRFFVLGLSPNASRLAVRFWEAGPARIFGERLAGHFGRLEIVGPPDATAWPSLAQMLRATVSDRKRNDGKDGRDGKPPDRKENAEKDGRVPPGLAGDVVRSVLSGQPYPRTLLTATLRGIRADRNIGRIRCAVLKAYLCGLRDRKEAVKVSLDEEERNVGYRLGRLFAVLEIAQERALGGERKLNSTIRDCFYGAASTTPVTVFPRLLKLNVHHLAVIDGEGIRRWLERLIGAIMDGLDAFPAHLSMSDQGRFAIGYHHQRQDCFRPRKDNGENNDLGGDGNERAEEQA